MNTVVSLEEDPVTGDLLLPISDDIMNEVGWKIGDTIDWTKNADDSWTLTKKEDKVIDRFDVEQQIMRAWDIIQDLELFADEVADKDMSVDDLMNRIMGLQNIYDARFNKLFETFSECIKNGRL